MTALSESFYLMSIHNIFSWLISTLLLFSRIGKPVLDTGPKHRQFGRRRNDGLPTEWLEDGTWHKKAIPTLSPGQAFKEIHGESLSPRLLMHSLSFVMNTLGTWLNTIQ